MSESRTSRLIVRDILNLLDIDEDTIGSGKAKKSISEIVEKHVDKILRPELRAYNHRRNEDGTPSEYTVDHIIKVLERFRGKNIGEVEVIDGTHETFCEGQFTGLHDGEDEIHFCVYLPVDVPVPKSGQKSILVDAHHNAPLIYGLVSRALEEAECELDTMKKVLAFEGKDNLTDDEKRDRQLFNIFLPMALKDKDIHNPVFNEQYYERIRENINPWITLIDTLKDLVREFGFFRKDAEKQE